MKKVNAISFDADGTLFGTFTNSKCGFETFFLEAARSHGVNATLETLAPILSETQKAILARREAGFKPFVSEESNREHWLWLYQRVFTALSLPNPHLLASEYIERYESCEFSSLYPDTIPCLKALAAKKIPMIIISNFSDVLQKFLTKFEIVSYFKKIIVSGHTGFEKPDPEIFELGAKALGLPAHEILHIGNDLDEDYNAAINAGFQALLLDRESRYNALAVPKIKSLNELQNKF